MYTEVAQHPRGASRDSQRCVYYLDVTMTKLLGRRTKLTVSGIQQIRCLVSSIISHHTPKPFFPRLRSAAQSTRSSRVPRRGPPGHRAASPKDAPDSIDEVRQRLISSSEYDKLINRLGGKNPFEEEDGAVGLSEGEAEEPAVLQLFWSTVRFGVDVGVILVPVVLCVSSGKLPQNVLAPFTSVAAAISGSPIEQVLETLPWERTLVLRSAAEFFVALVLSPLADRLIVAPAIHLWGQIRLRSLSS